MAKTEALPALTKEDASDGSSELDDPLDTTSKQVAKTRSKDELLAMVYEMQTMDFTPIQDVAFNTIVPIPTHYYWDVVENDEEEKEIPIVIKAWHNTVAGASYVGHSTLEAVTHFGEWFEKSVAQPIATQLGVVLPRLTNYAVHMEEDMDDSANAIREEIKEELEGKGKKDKSKKEKSKSKKEKSKGSSTKKDKKGKETVDETP